MNDYEKRMVAFAEKWRAFVDAVNENAEREAEGVPQDVRNIAITLCRNAGYEPDLPVIGLPGASPIIGPKGMVVLQKVSPAWFVYLRDAYDMVEIVTTEQARKK